MTLTREEILALPPGRELDALVAKYVMFPRHTSPLEEVRVWSPRYSTDILSAWAVVDKMRQNKIYLDIRVWPDEYQVLPHQDENNKLIDRWIVKKPSLPEAIGKAALLAVFNL